MASKNKQRVVYEGVLDPTGVLEGLQKIQENVGKIKLSTNLSKELTKEFSSLEKRLLNLQAKKEMGFSSATQVESFEKEALEIQNILTALASKFKSLKLGFEDIEISSQLTNKIKSLNSSLEEATNKLKDLQNAGTLKLSNLFEKLSGDASVKNKSVFNLRTAVEEGDLVKIQTIMDDIRKNAGIKIVEKETVVEARNALETINREVEELRKNIKIVANQELVDALERATELKERLLGEANLKLSDLYTKSSNYKKPTAKADENNAKAEQKFVEARRAVDAWREAQAAVNKVLGQNEADLENAEQRQAEARETLEVLEKQLKAYETIVTITNILVDNLAELDDAQKAAFAPIIDWARELRDTQAEISNFQKEIKTKTDRPIKTAQNSFKKQAEPLENLSKGFNEVNAAASKTKGTLEDLARKENFFGQLTNYIGMVFSLSDVFGYANRAIRYTFQTIKELDAAFTEISVVTDLSSKELWNSFDGYNAMAQQLGITTKDAIETSALYYQQGLDTAEVMELTAETVKMARIANMNYAEATDRMTAALRGFKLEMNEAVRVNDVFSALAAASAVDTDELSYALTKTASIAASAGMELETTSALLSQMIETTREAPENIGTAMKTIIARFQELKKNVDEVEIEGEIVDVNKVEGALREVGIKLRDEVTGQFRDLDDVFLELSSIWDTLDRNTQRYIATISAGSRQQSRFLAMMDNYERTVELVNIANSSAGASASQFNKTLGSIEAKINKLSSSAEELVGTLFPNEFIRGILDIANNFLQVFNTVGDAGPIALAAFSATAIQVVKNISRGVLAGLREASDAFDTFRNHIEQNPGRLKVFIDYYNGANGKKIVSPQQDIESGGGAKISTDSSTSSQKNNAKDTFSIWTNIAQSVSSILSVISLIYSANTTTSGLTGGVIGQSIGQMGGAVAGKFIGSAIGAAAGPVGAIIGQALGGTIGTMIGTAIGNGIDKSKGMLSETFSKAMEEAAAKFQEEVNKASKEESELSSLITEYEKLTEVLSTGEGTLEQQERLKEVNEELISLYPEAQAGYNAELNYRRANLDLLKQELAERQELKRETQLRLGLSTDYVEAVKNRERAGIDKDTHKSPIVQESDLQNTDWWYFDDTFKKAGSVGKLFLEDTKTLFDSYIKNPKDQNTFNSLKKLLNRIITNTEGGEGIGLDMHASAVSLLTALDNYNNSMTEVYSAEENKNKAISKINNQFVDSLIASDEILGPDLSEYSNLIKRYVNNSINPNSFSFYDTKTGAIDEKEVERYQNELEAVYNKIATIFDGLEGKQKDYVIQALSLKGLVDAEEIGAMLKRELGDTVGPQVAQAIFGVKDGKLLNDTTVSEAYGSLYITTVAHIKDLAGKGKYDVATILANQLAEFSNSDKSFNAFSTAYQNIVELYGIDSDITKEFFKDGIGQIKNYSSDLFEASAAVERLTEKLNKLEEHKDAIQSGSLSAEQAQNLVSTYNLTLDNFQVTAEGYKLVGTNYYELAAQAMEKTQQTYLQQIQTLGQIKSQLEAQRNNLGQERTEGNAEKWDELTKKINDATNSIILYGQAVSSLKAPELYVTSMQQAADNMDKLVANTEVLQEALNQFNEYGKISGTTFSKLIQANSDYIEAIDVTNGQITINKEKLEELRRQEIENYKTENEINIKKLEAENSKIQAAINSGEVLRTTIQNEIDGIKSTTTIQAAAKEFLANTEIAYGKTATQVNDAIDNSSEVLTNNAVGDANDIATAITNTASSYRGAGQTIINAIGGIIKKWNIWKRAQTNDIIAEDQNITVGKNENTNNQTSVSRKDTELPKLEDLLKPDDYDWNKYKENEGLELGSYLESVNARLKELKALKNKNDETIKELQALSELALKISQTGGALGTGSSKNQKEYNLEFEKFYNILSKIADIQRELNELERQRKETSHYEELAKIDAKRLDLSEALIASRKVYLQQQKEEQKKIGIQLGTYKKYVTVLDGYLSVNRAAIEAIKDETLGETLKDLIKEYDDLSESIDKTNEEILKEKEYQEEIIKSAREYSQTLKDTLLDEVIEAHEKEIQAVKDKYAAIKQEDTNYLNSLRENLQKERDLRNREDEEEELLKLEKRLALLKRDTSGIYSSEILQLESEIADMRQSMADSQTDKMLEELEEQYNSEHKNMDEETQYLDNKHKENLESMQVYWDEVEEIMANGYDAILEYLKLTDEEFITGSKEEQEAWLEEWKKNINEALAYRQGLQNNFGRDEQKESAAEIPSTEEIPSVEQETTIKTTPEIGERVELKSGKKIYGSYDAQKGVNPYFGVGPYTVLRTKNGRVQVKYANAKTGGAIGWLNFKDLVGYNRGGLVTDTGPVMVHGSKQRPEAFLSADDTKLIMNLKNALASMAKRNDVFGTDITNAEKAGDTFYEIHIHVDELNNDYDVEQMMTAMERKIVNDARSRNVIAIKRSR